MTLSSNWLDLFSLIIPHNSLITTQEVTEGVFLSIRVFKTSSFMIIWGSWVTPFLPIELIWRLSWCLPYWNMFFRNGSCILTMTLLVLVSLSLILKEKASISLRSCSLCSIWSLLLAFCVGREWKCFFTISKLYLLLLKVAISRFFL
jgi:hypothetical protein